jgi:lipopolysaccharide heptosyltransferase II
MSPKFRRILISRMKFIGDIVLTTPFIRSVRTSCPDAFIAYLGEKNAVALLEQNPHLDEVIPFDFSRPTILEQTRVALHLRRLRFDMAFDLFGNPRTALLTYLSGAPTRVGQAKRGRGRLYTVHVRDDERRKTAVEFYNQFLRAVGISPVEGPTEIVLTDAEREGAWSQLPGVDRTRPLVGIHPGATWPAKKWLPERFAILAERMAKDLGVQVVVMAGPRDGDIVQMMRGVMSSPPMILQEVLLRRLAAVIAHCRVFVSNDAGPMHIAAAVGTPTIGIFGPGEEDIWFPYEKSRGHRALRKDVPCHPCHLDFCNRMGDGYMECMKLLAADDVLAAVASSFR